MVMAILQGHFGKGGARTLISFEMLADIKRVRLKIAKHYESNEWKLVEVATMLICSLEQFS